MAVKFDLEMFGDAELFSDLSKASAKVQNDADKVIKNNGELMKSRWQRDAAYDTGYMHDNIITYGGFGWMTIHSLASYSGYVEYGTRYMPAQPAMRLALFWLEPKHTQDMLDVVNGAFK